MWDMTISYIQYLVIQLGCLRRPISAKDTKIGQKTSDLETDVQSETKRRIWAKDLVAGETLGTANPFHATTTSQFAFFAKLLRNNSEETNQIQSAALQEKPG